MELWWICSDIDFEVPVPPQLSPDVFFDFFDDVPRASIGFGTISGVPWGGPPLKTRCFRWSCHEKVKKTLHRSVTRVTYAVKTEGKCTIWNSSPDPADPDYPPEMVPEPALWPSLPHAPGARMTWVLTNSLKLHELDHILPCMPIWSQHKQATQCNVFFTRDRAILL